MVIYTWSPHIRFLRDPSWFLDNPGGGGDWGGEIKRLKSLRLGRPTVLVQKDDLLTVLYSDPDT
jgi:hypothetical protein